MLIFRIILACFLLQKFCVAQNNYLEYHQKINLAEGHLMNGNAEKAFEIYSQIFKRYDFVFAKDCLIAAQYAYHFKKRDYAISFIKKGFSSGLKRFHIFLCPLFNKIDAPFAKAVKSCYDSCRNIYLQRVKPEVVKIVLDIWFKDQIYKNINPKYVQTNNGETVIDTILSANLKTIVDISNRFGFPGEKLLGIVTNDILEEFGADSSFDLPNRYRNLKEKEKYNRGSDGFELNNLNSISNNIVMFPLYHHPCAFQKFGRKFLTEAIVKGQLHPNDFGLMYFTEQKHAFNKYTDYDRRYLAAICPDYEVYNGGYGICQFVNDADSNLVNKNRSDIGMCSLSHYSAFSIFSRALGIIVRFSSLE